MKIETQIARLTTTKGFIEAFEEEISNHKNMPDAYYAVEKVHHSVFGYHRYSGYDSFRKVRERKLKKKQGDILEQCSL